MSDNKEKISAFLDNELESRELEALAASEEFSAEQGFGAVARYQMIGDAMRGEISDASMIDISQQVREALQGESLEVVDAPGTKPGRERIDAGFDFSAWIAPYIRPLGGFAVAASIALVTVITVTRVDSGSEPVGQLAEADSHKINRPAAAVVAVQPARPVVVTVASGSKGNRSRTAAYLDTYLAEHAEFAAQDTMQGRMPYARAVSYESK